MVIRELTTVYPTTRRFVFKGSTTAVYVVLEERDPAEVWCYAEAYVEPIGAGPYRTPSDNGALDFVELAQVDVQVRVSQRPAWTVPLAPLVVVHHDFETRLARLEAAAPPFTSFPPTLRRPVKPPLVQRYEQASVHLSRSPEDLGLATVVVLVGIAVQERI